MRRSKFRILVAISLGWAWLLFTGCSSQTPDRVSAATAPASAATAPAPDPSATEKPFTVSGPLIV